MWKVFVERLTVAPTVAKVTVRQVRWWEAEPRLGYGAGDWVALPDNTLAHVDAILEWGDGSFGVYLASPFKRRWDLVPTWDPQTFRRRAAVSRRVHEGLERCRQWPHPYTRRMVAYDPLRVDVAGIRLAPFFIPKEQR